MADATEDEPQATPQQEAACRSIGTNQCAAICLSHLPSHAIGDCPEAKRVWTPSAIADERRRRPTGPLAAFHADTKKGTTEGKGPLGATPEREEEWML